MEALSHAVEVVPLRRASAKHRPMEIGDELTYVIFMRIQISHRREEIQILHVDSIWNRSETRLMEKGYESAHSLK